MLITLLEPAAVEAALPGLADVLVDCVDGGASVGFLAGLAQADAVEWWRSALATSPLRTWVARDDDGDGRRLRPAGPGAEAERPAPGRGPQAARAPPRPGQRVSVAR